MRHFRIVTLGALLLALTLGHGVATADVGGGAVSPADGSLIESTPRTITLNVVDGANVVVTLRDRDGNNIQFTGETRYTANSIILHPPFLDTGTYILQWRWQEQRITKTETSSFSVGAVDAEIAGRQATEQISFTTFLVAIGAVLCGLVVGGRLFGRRNKMLLPVTFMLAVVWVATGQITEIVASGVLLTAIGTMLLAQRMGQRKSEPNSSTLTGAGSLAAQLRWEWLVSTALFMAVGASMIQTEGGLIAYLNTALLTLGAIGVSIAGASGRLLRETVETKRQYGTHWPVIVAGWTASLLLLIVGWQHAVVRNLLSPTTILIVLVSGIFLFAVFPLIALLHVDINRKTEHSVKGSIVGQLLVVCLALTLTATVLPTPAQVNGIDGQVVSLPECLNGTNGSIIGRCLGDTLTANSYKNGVEPTLKTLQTLLSTNSKARFFCHESSHAIGRASLKINGNIGAAFQDGFDVCDYGYYHGIIEAAVLGMNDTEFASAIPTLCSQFADEIGLFFMQCNHGIGHAAGRRTNNDLLRGLAFCDAVTDIAGLAKEQVDTVRNGCGTGVTMEWFAVASRSERAGVLPEVDRLRDVCAQVPVAWAPECFEYVGNTLNASDPVNSLLELATWCDTASETLSCYRGLARAAAGTGILATDALAVCRAANTAGIVKDCMFYYIVGVATTIDYDVAAVDRICALLPTRTDSGMLELCERARQIVVDILAAGGGRNGV